MMKLRLAGMILLMGVSMAAQARHSHTFVLDDDAQDVRAAVVRLAAHGYQAGMATFDRGHVMKVHHHGGGDDPMCGPIPEPGTYAMLLAGLGLMTTIARRKRMDR